MITKMKSPRNRLLTVIHHSGRLIAS